MAQTCEENLTYEQLVETFVKACGLRKAELERLRVRDFSEEHHDFWYETHWVHVDAFEDVPAHEVPIEPNRVWIVARVCQDRGPDDLVFPELPDLDYDQLREEYADGLFQCYYEALGLTGAPNNLPELGQHLKQALGLRHYDEKRRRVMRWARRDIKLLTGV
jgi:integrase